MVPSVNSEAPCVAAPEEPGAQVAWTVTVLPLVSKISLPSFTAVLPMKDVA